jgi:hypothetical protein
MFDYEDENNLETKITVNKSGLVVRNSDGDLFLEHQNSTEFRSETNKPLFEVKQVSGHFTVQSMTDESSWKKQGNTEETKRIAPVKEPLYKIIKCLETPYVLKLDDKIKFGRMTFQVTTLGKKILVREPEIKDSWKIFTNQ